MKLATCPFCKGIVKVEEGSGLVAPHRDPEIAGGYCLGSYEEPGEPMIDRLSESLKNIGEALARFGLACSGIEDQLYRLKEASKDHEKNDKQDEG